MILQLAVSGLEVKRGARVVIRDLSFTVAGGEALLLTGANGAGKTTLIRTLAGLMAPAAGEIRLGGVDHERERGEHCAYVGHLNSIKASLTVAENLTFWAEYLGEASETRDGGARVAEALEKLSLEALADIPGGYLSAGQKRRLGLARLLVAHRPVWLLDEPTVSLDTASVRLLAEIVDAHVAAGNMVVAATHLDLGLKNPRELRLGPAAKAA